MSHLMPWFGEPWLEVLGEALLHSLWQGLVLWGVLLLVLTWRRNMSATYKHALASLALTLLALCPMVNGVRGWIALKGDEVASARTLEKPGSKEVGLQGTTALMQKEEVKSDAPLAVERGDASLGKSSNRDWNPGWKLGARWFALLWMLGIGLVGLRWFAGWWWLRKIRVRGENPGNQLQLQVTKCEKLAGLDAVVVRVVHGLGIPVVVGWLKPMVYFPASLLSKLNALEIEALLLHEMAHLKRRDPRLHLWITVVETILFFNPSVWGISKLAREAAEHACDDLVLQWQGERLCYAKALSKVEEWRGERLALAAGGGGLHGRIRRILGLSSDERGRGWLRSYGWSVVLGSVLFLALGGYAVPRLAKVWTDEERVAVIRERQVEWKVDEEQDDKPLIAEGRITMPDGGPLPDKIVVIASSKNYQTGVDLSPSGSMEVQGRGAKMTISAWANGFAPLLTESTSRDPATGKASFELVLERGYPAWIKLVDENGVPLPNVGGSYYYIAKKNSGFAHFPFKTEANGRARFGNVSENIKLGCEVLVHGYQWWHWRDVAFEKDKETPLKLIPAKPLVLLLRDATSGKPVTNGMAGCKSRADSNGEGSGYDYAVVPMAKAPSDINGRLILDVCRDESRYEVVLEAPGYARQIVRVASGQDVKEISMEPERRLRGVIKLSDHELNSRRKTWSISLSNDEFNGEFVRKKVKAEGDEVKFEFAGLSAAEYGLRFNYEGECQISLTGPEGIKEVRLQSTGGEYLEWTGGSKEQINSPAPLTRSVELTLRPPRGVSPYSGKLQVIVNGEQGRWVDIQENRGSFQALIGKRFVCTPLGLAGFTFVDVEEIVVNGDGPLQQEIQLQQAGAISGEIGGVRDREFSYISGSAITVENTDRSGDSRPSTNGSAVVKVLDGGKRYFASPLLLGRSYRIQIKADNTIVESKEVRLDESQPVAEANIELPSGVVVRGKVVQENGKMPDLRRLDLNYRDDSGKNGYGWSEPLSGDCVFELKGINLDMPGRYTITVPGTPGYAETKAEIERGGEFIEILRPTGIGLRGKLVDWDGNPIVGAKLRGVVQQGRASWTSAYADAVTDELGRFSFSQLKTGVCVFYTEYLAEEKRYDWNPELAGGGRELQLPHDGEVVLKVKPRVKR